MNVPHDQAGASGDAAQEQAHDGARVRGRMYRAMPYGIMAFLAASVVAPLAAPSLGSSDEFAAALSQLGGMGGNYLADVLASAATRMRDVTSEPSDEQWRDLVAQELFPRLQSSDERAQGLQADVEEVLRKTDAIFVALDEAAAGRRSLHTDLVENMARLAGEFVEIRRMHAASEEALAGLQRQLAVQDNKQREQAELIHRVLMRVLELRRQPTAGPSEVVAELGEGRSSVDGCCPFPGLASFDSGDADWFCGRESLVAELFGRLAEQGSGAGPLLVMGVSGVGKSSVLHAGVLAAFARGEFPQEGSRDWPRVSMTPGGKPLITLANRLSEIGDAPSFEILRTLRDQPEDFGVRIEAVVGAGRGSGRPVIVVDQFEEVFTHCRDRTERVAFVTALVNAAPAWWSLRCGPTSTLSASNSMLCGRCCRVAISSWGPCRSMRYGGQLRNRPPGRVWR